MIRFSINLLKKWNKKGKIPWYARLLCPSLHFCNEFDGLLIDKYSEEAAFCSCLGIKLRKDNS